MADAPSNYPSSLEPERRRHPPDYHVMVLLVDDQAMVCEAVRRALANQTDIDFHYCADAGEAISLANQIKPTVILQDLVMPGMDGLTLVNQYRANPATQGHSHHRAFHQRKSRRSKARPLRSAPTTTWSSCPTRSSWSPAFVTTRGPI